MSWPVLTRLDASFLSLPWVGYYWGKGAAGRSGAGPSRQEQALGLPDQGDDVDGRRFSAGEKAAHGKPATRIATLLNHLGMRLLGLRLDQVRLDQLW